MVYAASGQVHTEMSAAEMGLWIDQCGLRGQEQVFVLKCPTHVAKILLGGAGLRLLIADVATHQPSVRCVGLEIADQAGHPLTTFSAYRLRSEQRLLLKALQQDSIPLHVFDELERNVGSCHLHFDPQNRDRVVKYLESAPAPYAGPFGPTIRTAGDSFEAILDKALKGDAKDDLLPIDCVLTDWQLISIYGIGSGDFKLDGDEGGGFEQAAHQLLESLFLEKAFRSPEIRQGDKTRELCDSLLVGENVLCVVEIKSLGLLRSQFPLDGTRCAQRVARDVAKGLRQLSGATRMLRAGAQVIETTKRISALARPRGQTIETPSRDCAILGLVVISDLNCDVDWKQTATDFLKASDGHTLYQVVDLSELRSLVGRANNPLQFVTNLILRWGKIRETGTMAIRVRITRE